MRKRGPRNRPPRFPRKFLVAGIMTIVVGTLLTLKTIGYLPTVGSLWSVPIILLGLSLLYCAFFKNGRESNVFTGIFFTLLGTFFLVMSTLFTTVELERIWPFFMLFAGVSLFFYGMKKQGNPRVRLVLPGLTIVCLALVFLPFSLRILDLSFREFVLAWWPLLIVVLGVTLVGADLLWKQRQGTPPSARAERRREDPDEF